LTSRLRSSRKCSLAVRRPHSSIYDNSKDWKSLSCPAVGRAVGRMNTQHRRRLPSTIFPGAGYQDLADDLVSLATLYGKHQSSLKDTPRHYQAADEQEARRLAERILPMN